MILHWLERHPVLSQDRYIDVLFASHGAHLRHQRACARVLRPGQERYIELACRRGAPFQYVPVFRECATLLAVWRRQVSFYTETRHLCNDRVAPLHDLGQLEASLPTLHARGFTARAHEGRKRGNDLGAGYVLRL